MQRFKCFLITPEKIIACKDVLMVTVPGSDGEMGVLHDHAPMLVTLGEGTVRFYEDALETVTHAYSIKGGFAHIREVETHILVSEVHPSS